MSVPLSLLIYNPIEAYILILLCDVIAENDTKFTIKRALLLWDFGATNMICSFQEVYFTNLYQI